MNYELKEYLVKIAKRMPLQKEDAYKLKVLNILDFIKSCLFIEGKVLDEKIILEIMEGGWTDKAALSDYDSVKLYRDIYNILLEMFKDEVPLDKKSLNHLYAVLIGIKDTETKYRSDDNKINIISYEPPSFNLIDKKLDALFNKIENADFSGDIIEKAVFIHNGILTIYPYEEKSILLSYIVMQYILISKKFFVIPVKTENYYECIYSDLKEKNMVFMYEFAVKNAVSKASSMLDFIDASFLK